MLNKSSLLIICMASVIAVISCTKKRDVVGVADCNIINAKFSLDISPLVQTTCAVNSACHGAGSVSGPGPLMNYAQISAASASIKTSVLSKRMPLGSSLSEANINKIRCWVESGSPDN